MKAWPPTVTVAVRCALPVLAAAVSVTVAGPVPLAVPTVTHVAPLAAVHAHPADVVSVRVVLPPAAATVAEVGEIAYVHVRNEKTSDGSLWPVPVGPTALTRAR